MAIFLMLSSNLFEKLCILSRDGPGIRPFLISGIRPEIQYLAGYQILAPSHTGHIADLISSLSLVILLLMLV